MMMMMITLALCMAVASWSSTLSWLLRKPSFLLLSSTWRQTNHWETVIWCLQPFKKQMHGVPSYWWFWFYIEIVIMILKPLPSSFWAPQQAPEALEPRLQNWLKSIDKCLHLYSWKTSKASMNMHRTVMSQRMSKNLLFWPRSRARAASSSASWREWNQDNAQAELESKKTFQNQPLASVNSWYLRIVPRVEIQQLTFDWWSLSHSSWASRICSSYIFLKFRTWQVDSFQLFILEKF